MKLNVLVVLVNYHSSEEIRNFIEEVAGLEGPVNPYFCVVDNSSDFAPKELSSSFNVQVISGLGNLGYMGGAQAGMEYHGWRDVTFSMLWITNSDVVLPADFLFRLSKYFLKKGADGVGYAPQVKGSGGVNYNPYYVRRPSQLKLKIIQLQASNELFGGVYTILYRLKKLIRANHCAADPSQYLSVYAVHGSSFVLPYSVFANFSRPYNTFLFGEELYVAEELRLQGKYFVVDLDCVALHDDGQSVGGVSRRIRSRWLKESVSWLLESYWKG